MFRRSAIDPLFSALFINECRNDYYFIWRLQNDGSSCIRLCTVGYTFSTFPQSFGVTLSLPAYIIKNNEEEEQNLLSLYTHLINLFGVCYCLINYSAFVL